VKKSPEEIEKLKEHKKTQESEKARRRQVQEQNVRRKQAEKEARKAANIYHHNPETLMDPNVEDMDTSD
jgi:hypothetical protein